MIKKEFGNVTFDYRVTDATLFLDPVIPGCVNSGCFAAQWAVGMSSPGMPWHRVD